MTDDEIQLAAHAYALRHDETGTEFWFHPEPIMFVEAERLHARGYLNRRWHGDDLVYRLSDQAMTAQLAHQHIAATTANLN